MIISDKHLEEWIIERHKECDEIDKLEDSFEAAGRLVDLVERIEGAWAKFPEDKMVRCAAMAMETMEQQDQLELLPA